jgi:hypothetical protein
MNALLLLVLLAGTLTVGRGRCRHSRCAAATVALTPHGRRGIVHLVLVVLVILAAILALAALFVAPGIRIDDPNSRRAVAVPNGSKVTISEDGDVDVTIPDASAKRPAKKQLQNASAKAGTPPADEKQPAAAVRPAWVDAPDHAEDAGYQVAVRVGPYATDVQCDADLPGAVAAAAQEYMETFLDHRAQGVHLRADRLAAAPVKLVAEDYRETVQTSVGPMRQLHARLVFDRRVNEWLQDQVRDAVIVGRLWYVGAAAACVLASLGLLLAYLKAGLALDGLRRSQKAAAVAALVLLAWGVWRMVKVP